MKYPTHLVYVSADKVKAKLQQIQSDKQRKMLKACDTLKVVEIKGELLAAIDIEVYQYLVSFLMERTEVDKKWFE